ncbi:MAG: hypothetical protein JJU05_03690 [Verrucomicrobia bacterium]|nr:hypothetical protein [Verrucomicrobiota bacterium]MCH8526492.1 hypothetical protein [Kiritimatiellia bacterium]
MRGRPGLWLLILLGLSSIARGADDAADADWEDVDWKTVRTEENRFVVNGLNPADTQGVAIWMEQTLRRLGRDFGVRAGFDPFHPLVVVLHPRIEEVSLHQRGRGRRLTQEIRAPEGDGFDSLRFAEVFLEAILYRMFDQQAAQQAAVPPPVPGWLTRGWAPEFVPERRGTARARGLARWRTADLNPPYTLTGAGASGGGSVEDEVWAVAYLFALVPQRERIWREMLARGGLSADWWRRAADAGSLREAHLSWEIWMAERGRRFLSDPSAGALFREQLARELVFTPGRFGLDGEEVPRDERMTLPAVAERLDENWAPLLLQAWRSRMSMLRFGQRAERLQRMDLYVKAAEALLEARGLRGSRRAEALERFRQLYDMATEMGREDTERN